MEIVDIYKKFNIPPNLARHMLTVAKVVSFIQNRWHDYSAEIDWDILIKSALLHDLGNVVKFDLEKFPEILTNEGENVEYWKNIQKEMIGKYGRDDHAATGKMLTELKVNDLVIQTILNKSFGRSKETAAGNNWYPKILLYADLRVAPNGVEALEDRLEELRKRSSHYSSRPDYPELVEAVRIIEKQIQEKVSITLAEISNESIRSITENFDNFNF